jgi:hypothetical protein
MNQAARRKQTGHQRLLQQAELVEQVRLRCLRADRRETDDLRRFRDLDRCRHGGDYGPGLEKAWRRVEDRRNHYKYAVHVTESGRQRPSIRHIGKGDLAAALLPGGALGGVAYDGANGQAGIQESARGGAADLPGNSRDCKHVVSNNEAT